jgi:hypothetical protein
VKREKKRKELVKMRGEEWGERRRGLGNEEGEKV